MQGNISAQRDFIVQKRQISLLSTSVLEFFQENGTFFIELKIINTMRLSFNDLHLAISEKLGWGEMPATVAIPAIDYIVNTACAQVCHATGCDDITFEEMAHIMLKDWSDDAIFAMLGDDEDFSLQGEMKALFISLRYEIEDEMRYGNSFSDAINE